MFEDEGDLLRDGIRVDGNRNGAQRLAGKNRPIETGAVGAKDGDFFPLRKADALKAECKCFHFIKDLSPGPGLPNPEILFAHRRPFGEDLRVAQQKLRKCIVSA